MSGSSSRLQPEKRIDLERLADDGFLDGRVMKDRDHVLGAQTRERGFELQRFVETFVDEPLDDVFTPRSEGTTPEPAGEPLHAGEADAVDFRRVAIERDDAGVEQDLAQFVLLVRFEVVVSENGDCRNLQRLKLARQRARFIGQAVIGEIAWQDEDVRRLR